MQFTKTILRFLASCKTSEENIFGTRNENYLYLYAKICSCWKKNNFDKILVPKN